MGRLGIKRAFGFDISMDVPSARMAQDPRRRNMISCPSAEALSLLQASFFP